MCKNILKNREDGCREYFQSLLQKAMSPTSNT